MSRRESIQMAIIALILCSLGQYVMALEVPKKQDESSGFLGLLSNPMEDDEQVVITDVVKDAASEKAGLKKGDILLKVGKKKIEVFADVRDALEKTKPGEKIEVVVKRGGKEKSFIVILGERKNAAR